MTEMTPGRTAYEAWWAKYIELDSDDPANDTPPPWFDQADDYRAAWEAAAEAAIRTAPPAIIKTQRRLSAREVRRLRKRFAEAVRSGEPPQVMP